MPDPITGYENRSETKSQVSPQSCTWEVEIERVGENELDKNIVYVRIVIDNQTIGTLRLPNLDYVRYLREKLSSKQE